MALANMTQKETNKENREHCKRIANDLEAYANGLVYRCPECGECFENESGSYDDETGIYHLPCGCETTDEPEQQTLYDYFSDCFDIEYRVSGRDADDLRSVRIMVACGGPNIYIDTETKNVELYWWGDRASYPIAYDVIDEIEAWASELWGCH